MDDVEVRGAIGLLVDEGLLLTLRWEASAVSAAEVAWLGVAWRSGETMGWRATMTDEGYTDVHGPRVSWHVAHKLAESGCV